jgi:hypothetical protein
LNSISPLGHYELVEWIDQYNRKGWYPIATQLNKSDIDNIIRHTVKINSKSKILKCHVCGHPVQNQAWICMESTCINNQFTKDLKSLIDNDDLQPFNTIIICNEHIGEGKQLVFSSKKEENHRIMLFVYEKARKGWIPKNIYRQFPHILEKKIITRRELIAQYQNDQFNPEMLDDLKAPISETNGKSFVRMTM